MTARTRATRLLLIGGAVVAFGAGLAYAAVPGADGMINGCYEKRTGLLRVIDADAGKKCLSIETPISWNQKGLKGDTGAQGLQGGPGVQGEQGVQGVRGERGVQGEQGERGPEGPPGASLTSVESLAGLSCTVPGRTATVGGRETVIPPRGGVTHVVVSEAPGFGGAPISVACLLADEYEPNDTSAEATSVSNFISVIRGATLVPVGDVDWYRLPSGTIRVTNGVTMDVYEDPAAPPDAVNVTCYVGSGSTFVRVSGPVNFYEVFKSTTTSC